MCSNHEFAFEMEKIARRTFGADRQEPVAFIDADFFEGSPIDFMFYTILLASDCHSDQDCENIDSFFDQHAGVFGQSMSELGEKNNNELGQAYNEYKQICKYIQGKNKTE